MLRPYLLYTATYTCTALWPLQFLESYKSVTLGSMAAAFGVSVDFMDRELVDFIVAGRLPAKIDKVRARVHPYSLVFGAPSDAPDEPHFISSGGWIDVIHSLTYSLDTHTCCLVGRVASPSSLPRAHHVGICCCTHTCLLFCHQTERFPEGWVGTP